MSVFLARRVVPISITFLLALVLMLTAGKAGRAEPSDSSIVPGQYIVVLHPGASLSSTVERSLLQTTAIDIQHVYTSAINGFAAQLEPADLTVLASDPAVAAIVPDRKIEAFDDIRPTGIRRSEADRNAITQISSGTNPIDVDVAVVDTGIDSDHPDLNVVGGHSCVPGNPTWEDANGHGTHVAGTIGALDNGSGVVGVAPGARLWSVRVLDAQGEGEVSDLICAVDWLTANADVIEVANLSLGAEETAGDCNDGALHQAICTSVEAGTTYVVAAGNSSIDASRFVPAVFDEVITVSAIVDTDGKAGGDGPADFFSGADDSLAAFSNFGPAVDIAAPGVGILSTYLGGGYVAQSGTSMAAPHVTGAAAIYLHQNPGASPEQVRQHLLSVAWDQNSPNGFAGDTDGYAEKLLNAGAVGGLPPLDPPLPPEAACTLAPDHGPSGTQATISCQGFASNEWVWIYWDNTSTFKGLMIASAGGEGVTTMTIPDGARGEHQVIAIGTTSGISSRMTFTLEPGFQLQTNSGSPGTNLLAIAKGFDAGEQVQFVWLHSGGGEQALKSAPASQTGAVYTVITIPEAPAGVHQIAARGTTSGVDIALDVTVLAGIKATPTITVPGRSISISVGGFGAQESVTLSLDGTSFAVVTASALGSATASLTVPALANGDHQLSANGSSGSGATATLKILSQVSLSMTLGDVGAQVTASLSGFGAGETVTLSWFDTTNQSHSIGSTTADANGSGSISFTVPEATNGGHRLMAAGGSSEATGAAIFVVRSTLALAPDTGPVGTTVTVTLHGFQANQQVEVRWFETYSASTVVATVSTSSEGSATLTFDVAAETTAGAHKVEALTVGSYVRASANFTVEAQPGGPGGGSATCLVEPASASPGMRMNLECSGFAPGQFIRIYLDSESSNQVTMLYAPQGSGSGGFNVPDKPGGEHVLIALGSNSGERFEVPITIDAGLTSPKASASPGTFLFLTLRGFGASESVNVSWVEADGTSTLLKTTTSDLNGRGFASVTVPSCPSGNYTIRATGATTGLEAETSVEVVPGLKMSPSTGRVGANLNVEAQGFQAGEQLQLFWDGVEIDTATASATGSARFHSTVPAAAKGAHEVRVIGAEGAEVSTTYQVIPSMTLSPTNGRAGAAVVVTFTGFAANETIRFDWYETTTSPTTVGTAQADETGSATITFTVPVTPAGLYKTVGVGEQSNHQSTVFFYVLS